MPKADLARLALAVTVSLTLVSMCAAQQSSASNGPWSGWARCQINVSGQRYGDQQTHTWMITGGTPTLTGAFRVYPATWSVVGGGSLQHTQGSQTLVAQWATTAQNVSAPLAVFVRASDGRMFIQARHAQMRAPRSVNGYQQQTVDGNVRMPGTIAAEAFEWAFPVVEVSRPKPGANAVANGSSTPLVNGSVGYMQPAGTQATASCTWHFGQGSDAPAPPPTIAALDVPKPAAVATTPSSGQPAGGAVACIGAPRSLATSVSANNVTMTWAAPASGVATSYVIQASSTAGGPANLANFNTGNANLSLNVSNVPAGSYYISTRAVGSCGTSAASNEVLTVVP